VSEQTWRRSPAEAEETLTPASPRVWDPPASKENIQEKKLKTPKCRARATSRCA